MQRSYTYCVTKTVSVTVTVTMPLKPTVLLMHCSLLSLVLWITNRTIPVLFNKEFRTGQDSKILLLCCASRKSRLCDRVVWWGGGGERDLFPPPTSYINLFSFS